MEPRLQQDALLLAASAEAASEHPLGKAILTFCRRSLLGSVPDSKSELLSGCRLYHRGLNASSSAAVHAQSLVLVSSAACYDTLPAWLS